MSNRLAELILENKIHHSTLIAWLKIGFISKATYIDCTFLVIFKDLNCHL